MSYMNKQPLEYYPAPANFNAVNQPPPPDPPYNYGGPSSVQQQTSNVVVVQNQPTPAVVSHTVQPVGDHYMTLSVILTILCIICGSWHSLLCTVPAIVFSTMARDAEQRGDYETAKGHGRISLGLNIASIISWVVIIIAALGTITAIAVIAHSNVDSIDSSSECYYYSYYSNGYYQYEYNC